MKKKKREDIYEVLRVYRFTFFLFVCFVSLCLGNLPKTSYNVALGFRDSHCLGLSRKNCKKKGLLHTKS